LPVTSGQVERLSSAAPRASQLRADLHDRQSDQRGATRGAEARRARCHEEPKEQELNFEGVERQPLRTFTEKAYLDYSMYVILDRALPHDRRRPEARAAAHHLRDERARPGSAAQAKKSARTSAT
jgi:hypothetical protein